MNHEARVLRNKLRKVAKANAQRIREEKSILALYSKIERQQGQLLRLQEDSQSAHVNLRTKLPFTPNGTE
jgi:hypothetical protein